MKKESKGTIITAHTVICPHCKYPFNSEQDYDLFDQIDLQDGDDCDYDVTCTECKEDFIIKGFENE